MKVGFIGAGKVGFSLGKYLSQNGVELTGYYSRSEQSAREAAEFTQSNFYGDLSKLVDDSDTVFVTAPDGAISEIWEKLRNLPIKNKNICHCSGSMSSTAFFNAKKYGTYIYSVHPFYAVSDKYNSYKDLSKSHFTIEGSPERLNEFVTLFKSMGNSVTVISSENKSLYHAAAVIAGNHAVALAEIATNLLIECGFERSDGERALGSLIVGNAMKIAEVGAEKALTGPVERNDVITIKKHLDVLGGDVRDIYVSLSQQLVKLASKRHPDRDYAEMERILENEKHGSNV